jgi:D-alanyl-D-alanine carboxypeptidase/D-alanyl-D-alanine-endopeptidase (penicillin-binding protein 4)
MVVLILLLAACTTSRKTSKALSDFFEEERMFSDHFTGFKVFDPASGKSIYQYQADKFFTPASNTKILSLFAALSCLGDSLPAIKYQQNGERLYIWGMADPTTLHPSFGGQDHIFTFINNQNLPVTFCTNHFKAERFGLGWAWDDYSYNYQAEKSHFPVFGNLLWISYQENTKSLISYPNTVKLNLKNTGEFSGNRAEYKNNFELTLPANKTAQLQLPLFMEDSSHQIGLFVDFAAQQLNAQENPRRLNDVAETIVAYLCHLSAMKKRSDVLSVDADLSGHPTELGHHVQFGGA